MIILGGRNFRQENLSVDILNLRNLRWSSLPGISRFRHANWCTQGKLFTFGGFESHDPDRPTNSLHQQDILALLDPLPHLKSQIEALGLSGDQKLATSLHQSMHTKYDLNENVMVARIPVPNRIHLYPLNSLQREAGKIKSKNDESVRASTRGPSRRISLRSSANRSSNTLFPPMVRDCSSRRSSPFHPF